MTDIVVKELIELLENLIKIPSPTRDEKEIAKFISEYAERNYLVATKISELWDVVVRIDGNNPGPKILFLAHMDHSKPDQPMDAYIPRVIDGHDFGKPGKVITGKGSCTSKGALAAMLFAGKNLASKKKDLKGSLIIAAVSRDLLANHDGIREVAAKGWVDADMAIIGEPSGNQPVIGTRGINHIVVTIYGRPTHWGRPQEGINPIWSIGQILGVVKELISDLPSHPSLGRATLTPIDIQCEISAPRTPNSCRIILDRRTLPGEDSDEIIREIKQKLEELWIEKSKIDVELIKRMYPFQGDPNSLIAKQLMKTNETISGKRMPYGYLEFASNGGYLTHKMKIPSIIYGPGRIEDMSNEHVEIDSVLMAARVYASTAFEILQDIG